MKRKDSRSLEKGNIQTGYFQSPEGLFLQHACETLGTNRSFAEQLVIPAFQQGISGLNRIFEVLPNELIGYPDVLPTSFVRVEKEIARCIAGCLPDVPKQKRHISYIRPLVHDYKVLRLVQMNRQTPTVSLDRVHSLLQDNFPNSCFCRFLNIMISGFMNVQTKVITF